MSPSPQFEHLAATWEESPAGTSCAALAEGYRKQGELAEAEALARRCVGQWPGYLPGFLVLARIQRDAGGLAEAGDTLRAALAIDPSHPVVFEDLAVLAELGGHAGDARAWRQLRAAAVEPEPAGLPGLQGFLASPASPGDYDAGEPLPLDEEPGDPGEEVLTESLAALYRAQGHLEQAAEVYQVLAARTPGNPELAERRDDLLEELAKRRPRPYDARESGGVAVGPWLAALASRVPPAEKQPEAGYDAFYQPPSSRETPEDFEAFQTWLKGLGR